VSLKALNIRFIPLSEISHLTCHCAFYLLFKVTLVLGILAQKAQSIGGSQGHHKSLVCSQVPPVSYLRDMLDRAAMGKSVSTSHGHQQHIVGRCPLRDWKPDLLGSCIPGGDRITIAVSVWALLPPFPSLKHSCVSTDLSLTYISV
jgi:hypothetical protein